MFMLNLLWRSICLLLSFLGSTFKAEYQLYSRILGNIVVYQSIVISTADSGKGDGRGSYRLEYASR
jgi:hypothetical protein